MKIRHHYVLLVFLVAVGCSQPEKKPPKETATKAEVQKADLPPLPKPPSFDADSAYFYTEKQVAFGPRVPNTPEHRKTAKWLEEKLQSFDWSVHVQEAEVMAFNGITLNAKNIVGRYDTANANRILLFAHWDTRPFADRGKKQRNKPIDGANDGASGVGVLLELARAINLAKEKPNVGIDVIFFDAEDYGTPEGSMGGQSGETWCLGSQYWAANPSIASYRPRYGILLDMVGAPNAVFPKEAVSMHYAPSVVNKVWTMAQNMGYQHLFINAQPPGGITDDHLYINKIANIPAIDIIHYEPGRMDFGSFHHTHDDNMEGISRETLKAVGEVVLAVLYSER